MTVVPKQLKMDGLDQIRDRLDQMAEALPGWQFQMSGAPEPHPIGAVQVEAHCPELKKHAGILLAESCILDPVCWKAQLGKMEAALGGIRQ
jgi:hypothetical protein